MKKQIAFQKQLTIGFTLLSIVSMLASGVFSYLFVSGIVTSMVRTGIEKELEAIQTTIHISTQENIERLDQLMNYWTKSVSGKIKDAHGMSRLTSGSAVQGFLNLDEIKSHALVDKISEETDTVVTIFARNEKGFMRYSTSVKDKAGKRAVGTYLAGDSVQAKSLLENKRYQGFAHILENPYFVSYEPIVQNGEVVGAFFMGTKDGGEKQIREYIKNQKILESGYYYILNSAGKMVLHPSKEGQDVLSEADSEGFLFFKEIVAKKNGDLEYHWKNPGQSSPEAKLALFRHIPEHDWIVTAGLVKAELDAPSKKLGWVSFWLGLGMTFAMIFATVLIGRRASQRLSAVSDVLEEASNHVEENAAELNMTSTDLAESSTQQAASVQQTVAAIEEINAMVGRNLDLTKDVKNLSEDMSKNASLGQKVLGRLNDEIQSIADKSAQIGEESRFSQKEMEKVIEVFASIEEKTKVINDIVFQTKILSFNASVEAARAGENGKGFAIVADEVGKLAQMSGSAANEIQKKLSDSRSQVEEIVVNSGEKMGKLIRESLDQVRTGVDVSTQCRSIFEDIIQKINSTHESIQQISSASNEQALGISEISKAAAQFEEVIQRNSLASQKVKGLSESLSKDSSETKEAVANLTTFIHGSSEASGEASVSSIAYSKVEKQASKKVA